jgi:hypothetical protein
MYFVLTPDNSVPLQYPSQSCVQCFLSLVCVKDLSVLDRVAFPHRLHVHEVLERTIERTILLETLDTVRTRIERLVLRIVAILLICFLSPSCVETFRSILAHFLVLVVVD